MQYFHHFLLLVVVSSNIYFFYLLMLPRIRYKNLWEHNRRKHVAVISRNQFVTKTIS